MGSGEQVGLREAALAAPTALDLPTDRPRTALPSFQSGSVDFEIDEALVRALKELSRRENASLPVTLLAAFQILLYRWSGQEHIAIGVPTAIGLFAHGPIAPSNLSGDPGFTTCLARVREDVLAARAGADLPLDKLVERLAAVRDLPRNPFYQASFRFGDTPAADAHGLDLSLVSRETAGRLALRIEYATELFDAATIERMSGHFRVLLEGIVADPSQPVSRLPLLTDSERRQLLLEWNDTTVARRADKCVAQLIEEQVAFDPEATAVLVGQQRLTYSELNRRANRIAHRLRALGVGPEVPVAVAMERSIELVVALLAILKSGGVYVPLDTDYPPERMALLLRDVSPRAVLTQARVADRLPALAMRPLCLDTGWSEIAGEPDSNPPSRTGESDLAYVIHTSGSTGQPKGVMVEQRSLLEHLVATRDRFAGTARDCVLQTAPIGFDQSIWQMLFALVCGARVALPANGAHRGADEIAADIRRHGGTILRTVPTLLAALLNGPGLRECDSLRLVIVVGEVLDRGLADAFAAQCGAELMNAYGASEATMLSTLCLVRQSAAARPLPVGRPLDNVRLYVVDRSDQPVPVGVLGELCIAGQGVARGYWRRPDLTARSFVPDPFTADPRARMYRTGDVVRYLPDGNLEFHGRRDLQVKLRGVRIELGEIESLLGAHSEVEDCVVTLWRDASGENRLVAHFVPCGGSNAKAADLRDFLRAKVPAYMVPTMYVRWASFPKTASGKIDRSALPAPVAERDVATGDGDVGPRNPVEERIAGIWAAVLGLDRTGVEQDFFDLGGHSLLAMQVLARIEDALGVSVSVREFFARPTIEALARKVEPHVAYRG